MDARAFVSLFSSWLMWAKEEEARNWQCVSIARETITTQRRANEMTVGRSHLKVKMRSKSGLINKPSCTVYTYYILSHLTHTDPVAQLLL